jgi:hypothetical protein
MGRQNNLTNRPHPRLRVFIVDLGSIGVLHLLPVLYFLNELLLLPLVVDLFLNAVHNVARTPWMP